MLVMMGRHGRRTGAELSVLRAARPLLAVGLAAYFLPLLSPLVVSGRFSRDVASTGNTELTSLVAAIVALLLFRRVTIYPGTRSFGFILPAFSTTFGVAAALLLVTRTPYSGSMLIVGYLASVMTAFLLGYFEQRAAPRRMYYVPTGNTGIVGDTPQIDWVRLTTPVVPDEPDTAIVVDLRSSHGAEWERMLAQAAISGVPVYHTKQLRESLTGRVEIEHLSENGFGSLLPAFGYREVKRAIDVVAAIVLLPILALPLAVIALLVRASSAGPVFFHQERMGYRGKPFLMHKFRTMAHREPGSDTGRDHAITQDDDQRVTSIGRFLRRSRLDELPQIVNILRGEMSWIGPRPEAVPLSHWYEQEIPFYRYRHIVRPGITGWAQVNQGHVAQLDDVHVKLHYDFYYVKFFSFWLDVLIAIRTVGIMLTGFGAK